MKQQGFTLIELSIVLAITALIVSFASPSYQFVMSQLQIQSDVGRLLMMLRTTREHAIISSATTVLCPSSDDKTCTQNWKLPLIQFTDSNLNKVRDTNEVIQKRFKAFKGDNIFIKYPKTQVRFNEYGMANFYNGTFGYCFKQTVKGVIISRMGRIRFAQDLNNDQVPDIDLKTPVSCR